MLSKNQIKYINALKLKKQRAELQLFVAEGAKIVPELMHSEINVKQVYATADFIARHTFAKEMECVEVKASELERISSLTTPNEVLAVCEIPHYELSVDTLKNKLTLVLDDIKDPGNMGTIIRIADWFGMEQIICSNESADIYNSKVVQATMGSIARVKVHYVDLPVFLKAASKEVQLPVYGALLDGENVYSEKLSTEGFIVIGNESRGIGEQVLPFITHKINIPSFSKLKSNRGEAESLNAAIAASIICSEFRRRN